MEVAKNEQTRDSGECGPGVAVLALRLGWFGRAVRAVVNGQRRACGAASAVRGRHRRRWCRRRARRPAQLGVRASGCAATPLASSGMSGAQQRRPRPALDQRMRSARPQAQRRRDVAARGALLRRRPARSCVAGLGRWWLSDVLRDRFSEHIRAAHPISGGSMLSSGDQLNVCSECGHGLCGVSGGHDSVLQAECDARADAQCRRSSASI